MRPPALVYGLEGDGVRRALVEQVRLAAELLSDHGEPRKAAEALTVVEDLLARLAKEHALAGDEARQLLALRDELGGQLLAAAALDVIELPHQAAGVLKRAADSAEAGLREILAEAAH
jgi:hypothetical protein